MRLNLFAPALAGALTLGLGLTANAAPAAPAAAPPAAPIIYCPTAPAAAPKGAAVAHPTPAACPTGPSVHHRHVVVRHVAYHRAAPRHHLATVRVVERTVERRTGDDELNAGQAFIYRYELARRGFEPRAADQAWRQTGVYRQPPRIPVAPPAPPPPEPRPDPRRFEQHDQWRQDDGGQRRDGHRYDQAPPQHWRDDGAAVHGQYERRLEQHGDVQADGDRRVIILHGDHAAPPPPCPCAPVRHEDQESLRREFERRHARATGETSRRVIIVRSGGETSSDHWVGDASHYESQADGRAAASEAARRALMQHNGERDMSGGGYSYERRVERGSSDGRGVELGDADGRYMRHDGRVGEAVSGSSGGSYSSRSRESDSSYAQGGSHDVSGQWRDGSYGEVRHYTGRNASGYLVWPGKTERDDTPVQ